MGRHLFRALLANGFFRRPENAPPTEPAPRRQMLLERLEDRLLFDAGPVAPVDAELAQQAQAAQNAMPLESSVAEPAEVRVIETLDQVHELIAESIGQPLNGQQDVSLDPNATPRDESLMHSDELAQQLMTTVDEQNSALRAATAEIRHELVFVDTSVAGYQALLDDLFAQASPTSVFEILLLDPTRDGVSQVTAALEGRSDLAAVHILSHGQAGGFQLGATWIDQQSLMGVSGEIARWASAFSSDGDLLIYGCNLAATAEGQQLIDGLSALTGADVAGSTDLTGSAALGGNWDLEYVHGTVTETIGQDATLGITWNDVLLAAPTAPESRVNTTTANAQETAFASPQAVASDAAGNYVVTWADSALDGSGYGVYFQRYNSSGVAQGAETRANTTTLNAQQFPTVDMDLAGNFVIAWSGNGSGDTAGVFAQRFNAAGVAQGAEFRVNTTTTNAQQQPSVALDSLGNFVIVWSGEGTGDTAGVFGQRYTAAGATIGGEFRINTTTTGTQSFAAVDMNPKGDFVVVWSGEGTGDTAGVFGQRYDTTGTAVGTEFRINTTTTNTQQYGRVAMNSAGGFVVTWSGEGTGDTTGVFARRYNSSGTALDATEFRVNTTVTNTQQYSTVASDSSGNFLVTWSDSLSDGSLNGVYAQRYNAAGVAQDVEFRVAGTTANDQQFSSAIIAPNTDFTIVWSGNGTGDTAGVFQRRFDTRMTAMYAASNASPFNISTINIATGAATTVGTSSYATAANARDPVSGDVFYIEFTSPTARLSRYNPLTGTNTLITTLASLPGNIIKLSFRSDGTLWAATGSPSNTLYQLNPTTGAVISSGVVSTLVTGSGDMAFDTNNVLWWNSGNSLYTVNVTTYVATLIGVITPAITINGFAFGQNGTLYAHAGNNIYTINQTTAAATLVGATGTTGIADLGSSAVNVNDVPINSVPATQSTNEDTARVFSVANGNLISITDVDAGTAALQITLTGTNGAISLSGTSGLTFTVGDGTTDSTMTFTGTLTNINAALAGLSFLPTANYFGPASLQIISNDQGNTGAGGAMSDSDTIGINVASVSDAPTTSNNSVTTSEETPFTFAAANFSFSDGDPGDTFQSVKITALPSVGSLTLGGIAVTLNQVISVASLGTLVFTPALNGNGSPYTTFNFQVSDGTLFSTSATMTVNVTPVNDPPTTSNNSVTTPEDTPVTFAAASFPFSDVDSTDTLQSVKITALPSVGSLTLGGIAVTLNQVIPVASLGTLVFTPALNANGSPYTTFTFQVSDGTVFSSSATMTVNVTPVNDPPTTSNNSVTTPEDTPVTFAAASFPFSDVDSSDTLQSVKITALPSVGTLTLGGVAVTLNQIIPTASLNTLVFTPALNGNGSPYTTFTFQVSDGTAFSSSATMTVNVTPVNDPPTTSNNSVTTPEDTPVTFASASFPFSDVDSADTLQSVKITALPSVGTLTLGGVAVTLNQVIPTASLNTLVFTPALNGNGSPYTTFTFQVSDGTVFSSSATMTVNVTPVNDPPTTSNNSVTTPEDTPVTFAAASFPFSDVDSSDTLQSVKITALPSVGTLTLGGVAVTLNQIIPTASLNTLVFTPALNGNGSPYTTFTFQVSDGTVFSSSATMTVNVTPVNDTPTTSNNSVTTPEDTPVAFAAASFPFSDVDTGDTLQSVKITALPSVGTLTLGGVAVTLNQVIPTASLNTLVFTPALNANGSPYTTFTFQVSDGTVFSSSATMTVNVTPVNDPPVADDETFTVAEDSSVIIDVLLGDTDLDGDTLAVTEIDGTPISVGSPVTIATGVVSLNVDGTLTFTPNTNYNGPAAFDYTASDGNGGTDVGHVSGTVTPVNDPPVADDESFTVTEDDSVIINVLLGDTDLDGDSLSVTEIDGTPISVGSPVAITTGVVSLNADGTLTFTPNANYNGPAAFDYTASDGNGGTDIGHVSGTVTQVNDPPVADDETFTVAEDGSIIINVLLGDTDLDGDTLTVTEIDGTAISLGNPVTIATGLVSLNADGRLTFTPNANFNGPASFDYTISDSNGGTDTGHVSGTVTPVNDPPVADDESFTVAEDGSVIVDVLLGDTDLDGDTLTVTEIDGTPISLGSPVTIATGVVSLNADGTLTFTPNANYNGPAAFDYTVSDGNGGTDIGHVSGTVTPVNDPPVADDESFTVAEDGSVIINVLLGDTDLDGDSLTVTEIDGTPISLGSPVTIATGVVSLNADGTLTFTPNANYNGPAAFDYTVSDGNGGTDIGHVSGTVTPVNDPPVADDETFTVAEDGSVIIDVLLGDTDLDGDTLSVTEIDGTPISLGSPVAIATGVVSLNVDGTLTFTPNTNFNGPAAFDYTVSDGNGGTDIGHVSGTVTPVNDPPVADDETFTGAEDGSAIIDVLLGDTDLDGDTLTVSEIDGTPISVGSPVTIATGVVSLNADGTLSFAPNANYNGPAAFDYTVSDGNGGTDIGHVSGTVTPINDPPVADDETFTVAEDGAVIIPVLIGDTDLDGDSLSVTHIEGTPISLGSPIAIATGVVSLNADGTLTFTPNTNFNGPAAFDYTVSDGNGGTDIGHVSGTVTPVNDPPVADDETFTVAEDGSVIIDVLLGDTDLDGDTLSVIEIDGASISVGSPVTIATGLVSLNADGTLTFTPNANYNGPAAFDYTVSDGNGGTDIGHVSGTVAPVNDPPVADDETFTVAEDNSVIIDVLFGDTDLDGDSLSVTEINGTPISVGSPVTIGTGVVSLNADGTLTFTPNTNFNGPASFDYTVSDGNGGTDIGHVSGTVTPVNDPPVADDESFTVAEDGSVIIDVLLGDTDLDGDTLTVSEIDGTPISVGSPVTIATGVVSLNVDGTLTFTPNANFNGPASFDYTVSDGNGGTDIGHASGTVTPVNDPPVADDETFTVAEDGSVLIDVLLGDTDLDGDTLSVTEIDGTPISLGSPVAIATGVVSLNVDGTLTFTPNANFNGPAAFDYTVSDGNGGTDVGHVSGTVTPVNDPPIADDETFLVAEDAAVIIPVLTGDTDLDGDSLIVTHIDGLPISVGSPVTIATGIVSLNADGSVTFTPNSNFNGPAAFDYTISDGHGGTDIGHVSGTVTPVNDAPVARPNYYVTAEDAAVSGNVLTDDTGTGVDSDIDGDLLSITLTPVVNVANGSLMLAADGSFTYTPNLGFNGFDSFTYELRDPGGLTSTAVVTIAVGAVNDPPVADDESFTVAEDGSVIIDVLSGDTDLDGDTLFVTEIDATPISLGSPVTIATGIVSLNADGTLTFTPTANYNGPAAFDYTVSDGNGASDIGHVSGTVTPVNDPPVADDESFTVAEDGSVIVDVLLGDTDLDGDTLSVTQINGTPISVGSPVTIATGVVSLNANGTLTFTPNANYNGPAAFDYTLNDGNGGTDIGHVSGTVVPVNDPPVADDESFTLAEDSSVIIPVLLGDTDLDGDTLAISAIDGTPISIGSPVTIATGVVSLNADGTLTFTPNTNFNGPAAFDYTVSDGNGGTDIGHVSGTVTPVNDPPVADDETFTVTEDGSVIIDVLLGDTDLDGDTLSVIEIDGAPISVGSPVTIATGVVSLNADGTLTFTPNANFNGPAAFDYTVSDGNGGTDIGHVSGTVTPANDPPVADDETFTVAEDGSVIIDVLLGDTDLDGDTLSVIEIDGVSISVGSPVTIATGVVSLNTDGTLTFTPNAHYHGAASFDYTVSDGQGGNDVGHVSGTVTPVNDPPVADDETFPVAEDGAVVIDVLLGDTDLDGDTLSVTEIDGTAISLGSPVTIATGVVSLNADGTLTFTPNANYNGPAAFDYTVSDGNGGTDIGHVSGTVTPVNDPPVADDESFTVAEDGSVIINVLLGDTDLDGDSLTVTEIDGTPISLGSPVTIATGIVSLNADGTLTFTPNANYNGPAAFDYTVSDGNGGTDIGHVSGTVTPVNDPPVADDETFTVAEDGSVIIDVLLGDTDLDGDTLSVTEIDGTPISLGSPVAIATGVVSLNADGTLTFTPNTNFNGPAAFDYTVSDGNGGTDIGHVSGTVTPVNDPPVADDETFTVAEDSSVIIDVLLGDTDLDGDTLTVSEIDGTPISVGSPVTIATGVVSLNANGTLSFAPNANYNGPSAFDYTVSDGNGGTDIGHVSGTVTPINDPPVADDETFTVAEDGSVIVDVLFGDTDLDGDSLSVTEIDGTPISLGSPVTIATGVVSLNADGTLTFTPNANYNGPAAFDYTVSDGNGGTDIGHVSGTVTPVNDPPVADDESFIVAEDGAVIIDVLTGDTDLDGDTLTVIEIDGMPISLGSPVTIATGIVSLNADGTLTFTPNANFNGPALFDYTVSDSNGGTDTGHVSGTVTPVNDPPVADDESFTVAEDGSVIVDVLLGDTDLDGDTLTVTEIDGTPISLGSPVTIATGVVSLNADGTLTFTPNANYNGPAAFDYTVSDGNGGTDIGHVSGTVTPVNDPPVADDESFTVAEDGSVIINVLLGDTDLDGDSLTVTEIDGTPISLGSPVTIATGLVSLNADGTLTFAPNANYNGPAAFDYTVSDGNGGTDIGHVSGTVTPVNDPPVADDETFTVAEDGSVIIDVLLGDTDLDGDTLSVTEIDGTPISLGSPVAIATGVVSLNVDGTLTFTPNTNFNGPAAFDYTVSDGNGGTDIGHVSGTVTPVNDPPVADDETFTVAEDGSAIIDVLLGDTDLDGDTLTVSEIDGTPISVGSPVTIATGVVSLNADGTLSFAPNANYNGPAAFDYTVSDGNGGTDIGHVSGTVTPINDPPVADDETFTVAEDGAVIIPVLIGDTDLDGDSLSVTHIDGTPISLGSPITIATGVVSLNADGTLTFTPNTNFNGPAAFDYTVSDGNGGTDIGRVSGTVTPVNDPPVADDETFTVAEDGSVVIDVLLGDTDLDGDTLSVIEIDGASISVGSPVTIATGLVSLNADGTLTFTPNANYNGPAAFDYTVSDGNGGTDIGHVSGTVTPVNDPPIADDETFTVAEDNSVIIDVLFGDTDLDGDSLSVTEIDGTPISVGSPVTIATGVVSLNADGTLSFTPNANYNGAATFDYTVSDGNGGTDIGHVSGTVTPVNDPPIADDESFTVAEDSSVIIDVLLGDTDLDGDTLSITHIDGTPISLGSPVTIATGVVSLNADGTLTFVPNTNYNGPAAFDYTVSDGNGGTDLGHASGTVTPTNDPPVARGNNYVTAEDTDVSRNVLTDNTGAGVDSDLDGDALSVTVTPVVDVTNGTLVLAADGSFTYTPSFGFNGVDSFVYEIRDPGGLTSTAVVTIAVGAVNDPPVADDDTFVVPEDGSVVIDVLDGDTDLDGDTLSVTEIDGTPLSLGSPVTIATGVVSLNADGSLTFTPNANFNGPAAFDYTVSDGNGGTDVGHVSGNVTPVNDPPVADDETFTVAEDSSIIIDVLLGDTDLDGDTLAVTEIDGVPISVGSPVAIATGVVSLNADGTLTLTPNANYHGSAEFDYTLSDGNGGTDIGHVSGTVTPVNDPPVADDEAFTVAEDSSVIIDVLLGDTDLDGDTLTVTEIDGTSISLGGPVTITTGVVSLNADGTLTFTPNANYNGPASFDYTVSDGNGGTDIGHVSGTVTPVNDPPVADDETFTVAEDGSVIIDVLTGDTDLDGDTLSVTEIDGTPISLGSPVTIATGVVSLNADGTLTFTPNANYNGPAAFDYTVSDGNGGTDIGHVSGTITPVNDPPVADDESFIVAEDGAVIIDVLTGDTDLDGDTLTVIEIDGMPISLGSPVTIATGIVSLNADGRLTFTPNPNYHGAASFDYTVSDGQGGNDVGHVSGTVTPVNDPPVADDESFTVAEDGSVVVDVLLGDTDLDGDTLTVTEIDGTPISLGSPVTIATGVVSLNADGTLTFTPNANYNGPAAFDYTVSDGNGGTDIGHVSGAVTPVNDPPVADDESFTVAEDGSAIINVLLGDTDLDGDSLTVTEIDGTPISLGSPVTIATGVVSLNADGTLTFAPNANYNGPAAFDYTVSDGNGGTDIGHVSGMVTPVNDPPVADDESFTVAEDGSVIIDVLNGDTDLDGDTLSVTEIDGTPISLGSPVTIATGVVSLNVDGTLTFTPNTNFNGPVAFDYTVSDGNGGTDIGDVSGIVTPVNDAPVARENVYATAEDTAVLGNVLNDDTGAGIDSDVDGDSLSVTTTPIVNVANGLLVLGGDGSFTYTPNSGFNGFDSFTYEIRDPGGLISTAVVTIAVGAVNDPPVADDETFTVAEEGSVIIPVLTGDTDLDGDALSVTHIDGSPISIGSPVTITTGVVSLNADGTLTFTPNTNFNGPVAFDYTVSDGNGGTDVGHVSGNVTPTTVSVVKSLFNSSDPLTVGSNVTIGEELCFALLVTMSEGNSTDLILTELLPDGLRYDSWTLITSVAASNGLLSGDFNGSVPAPSVSGGTFDGEDVAFTFGAITVATDGDATNNSFVLLVHAFVSDVPSNHNPLAGQPTLTNIVTADVSNAQPPVSSNPFDVTVVEPDLSVTIDNGLATLTAGQTTTYTITIANDGDSPATGLVLSGSLPIDRVTFVASDDAAHFSIDGSGNFTWTPAVGSLAPSGTLTLLLTVQVNSSLPSGISDVTIPVSVTHNNLEPTPANNSAADNDTLNAAPDLRLTKTDFTNSISPGQCTTYTLNVGNFGTQAATNVVVTETIPIGGTFNPALSDPGWMSVGGGVYQYSILSLPAGASFNVNLSVLINSPAVAGQTQIINTATISDDGTNGSDLDPTNNSATDIDLLDALPMYDIGIDDLQLSAIPGESLTYYVNFNNYGLQNGTGVIVSASFPTAILTNVVASNGGVVDAMAGTITWNVGALSANDPRTFEVTADVRATLPSGVTDFTLTAAINDDGANGPDPDLSDNSAADTDTLNAQPDYAITINDGKSFVRPGDPLTYTIHVANNGNQNGSGVAVTVSFPTAVLENVVASNGGIVDGVAGTITWNLGDLAAGNSTTLTINTQIRGSINSQTTSLTLTATVTDNGLNGPDPTPSNNLARDLDSFQFYAYDSFHDWKDMRVAWLMPQSQTVGRPFAPLPVDPVFSGLTEPGSTLVARIYGADGRLLGDRQVVADAGGNWMVTFPNMIIYEQPHRMEIVVTPAISNVSHENGFNLRRYFHPAIHAGLVMTESLSIAGVFRSRASNIVEAQHSANTHPLGFQWFSHAYELNAASSNISQM